MVADLPRGQVSLLLDEIRPTPAGTAGGTAVDLAGLIGMAALRELVLDNLPLDDERELETKSS